MKRRIFHLTVVTLLALPLVVATAQGLEIQEGDGRGGFTAPAEPAIGPAALSWQITTVDDTGDYGRYASLALDSAGRPHIAYFGGIELRYAYHDGSSWHIETVDAPIGTAGGYSSLALDSSDQPHISYYEGTSLLKYAHKSGGTWTIQAVNALGLVGQYTSLALDSSDLPHIAYQQTSFAWLMYAYHDGASWQYATVDTQRAGAFASLALDSSDRPRISFCRQDASWACEALNYAYYDGADWITETVDTGIGFGSYTSLALDASDHPRVSYYGGAEDVLKYAYYDGAAWITETVDVAGEGHYTSLDLDSSGWPHISCYRAAGADLKYAYHDGSTWHVDLADTGGDVGQHTSLALDDAGGVHIAYYDATHGDLKYAYGQCNAVAGVNVTGPAYLPAGQSGTYTAMAVPSGATEPISYDWDSGASGVRATYSWPAPGTFTITVTATNACGTGQGAFTVEVGVGPSPFGMNMGFTSSTRSDEEVELLSPLARAIGVPWSRERIAWVSYAESWGPGFYDRRIGRLAQDGFGIIGVLLTTPEWARKAECAESYWCPPQDPNDFAGFAAEVVERYDGDGSMDAPGSPRVAYWEVWDQPDQPATWLPQPDAAEYTAMLCATYAAIKQADPTAGVLVGGMTDWDTVGLDGFMDAVVAAGGWPCFDVLSYHAFILESPPEEPGVPWNFPSRLQMVQDWIAANGGGKEAWATEFGWSTCDLAQVGCQPGQNRTEDEQANFIVRAYGIIIGHAFQRAVLFQLEDATDGGQTPFGECAIIRDDSTTKPAYTAYGVMVDMLTGAQYAGQGPLYDVGDTWDDCYDYGFLHPDGTRVDLMWQLQFTGTYDFPVEPGVDRVYLYDRDGTSQILTPVDGYVPVTLSERPQYLVRSLPGTTHSVFLPLVSR